MNNPKARILVAEDMADSRHPLMMMLRLAGFACLEADNGRAAIELALQEKQITSINIPVKKHHNIPIVLQTLREHFSFHEVPDFIFDLIDLPEPSFDIFNKLKAELIPSSMDTTETETEVYFDMEDQ